MGSVVVRSHCLKGLQLLVLLCWLLVNLQVGFAEMQIKWIPAEDSNGESGGRPSLPYSQRKLDEMNITEEDLPDYFFPDDHPTRGTGNANSTRWTKTNKKKLFLTGLGVVAVYVWYRRRHRQQNQTYQSQHDYSGKGMRVGSSGETGGIGSKFGSLTSRIASESDEKKLEAAREARLRRFIGDNDVSLSQNVNRGTGEGGGEEEEDKVLELQKRSAALRYSVNITERNQQLGSTRQRVMRIDDLPKLNGSKKPNEYFGGDSTLYKGK